MTSAPMPAWPAGWFQRLRDRLVGDMPHPDRAKPCDELNGNDPVILKDLGIEPEEFAARAAANGAHGRGGSDS